MTTNMDTGGKYQKFAEEILNMAHEDQRLRLLLEDKDVHEEERKQAYRAFDAVTTKKMKDIVRTIGWPTVSRVGEKASHAAWLLVQHSPDTAFQKCALALMRKESKDEVRSPNIAFLTDRILIREGKPQCYGTWFVQDNNGKWVPEPIWDKEHVNERRKEAGLNTLEERTRELNEGGPASSLL